VSAALALPTMPMNPVIAVITPTKNRLRLLCEALDSVQSQTFTEWEHIIVDDGSDDGTAEEVARRAAEDARIRFIRRTSDRSGANVCRNLGIRESIAELIVFLDSDDLLASDCLRRRVALMQRNPDLAFVVFDGDVFQGRRGDLGRKIDTGVLGNDLDRFLALELPWIITGPTWRKEWLSALGGWDESLLASQDLDLHIRALARSPRYWRERLVDHHIRWTASEQRISCRKAFDIDVIHSCASCLGGWRQALAHNQNLSPQRERALAGSLFHLSQQLAGLDRLSAALKLWVSARDFGVPNRVLAEGTLMLRGFSSDFGNARLFLGLLRRWKAAYGFNPALPVSKCADVTPKPRSG
jgi:glycosyltransferase involved in cell wall biosynthesis